MRFSHWASIVSAVALVVVVVLVEVAEVLVVVLPGAMMVLVEAVVFVLVLQWAQDGFDHDLGDFVAGVLALIRGGPPHEGNSSFE